MHVSRLLPLLSLCFSIAVAQSGTYNLPHCLAYCLPGVDEPQTSPSDGKVPPSDPNNWKLFTNCKPKSENWSSCFCDWIGVQRDLIQCLRSGCTDEELKRWFRETGGGGADVPGRDKGGCGLEVFDKGSGGGERTTVTNTDGGGGRTTGTTGSLTTTEPGKPTETTKVPPDTDTDTITKTAPATSTGTVTSNATVTQTESATPSDTESAASGSTISLMPVVSVLIELVALAMCLLMGGILVAGF